MTEIEYRKENIYAIRINDDSFYLDAYIDPDTFCLILAGKDFSKTALEWYGNEEYEYFYSFSKKNTEKLKMALCNEDVLTAVKDFFHGEMLNAEFRAFCEKSKIKYEIHVI